MSSKRLHEKGPQVKRKTPLVGHTVDDGFAVTIREFTRGMDPGCVGKTRRGRINNSAYFIKKRAMEWADGFPKKINGVPTGFTPAVREVFKAIVWSHLMNRGYAVFSYDTLSADTGYDRSTVHRAINFLRARGLIQFKTGRGWEQKERRSLANQYTANLWTFINPEIGTIIDPPYHTGSYEWKGQASRFRARLKKGPQSENATMVPKRAVGSSDIETETGPSSENATMVKGNKRRTSARPSSHFPTLYSDNGIDGAKSAAPSPSADAAGSGSAARPKEKSDRRKARCISIKTLAHKMDMTFDGLIELFDGNGSPGDIENLDDLCKREIFNLGKPTAGILQEKLPSDVAVYGCVVVHGDEGRVRFVTTKTPHVQLAKLGPDSWLVIDYRVSPAYQIEVVEKLQALRIGV